MSTPESVKAQLQELIDKANATTGRSDTDLTAAVDALIVEYGTGGGDETACSHENTTITYRWLDNRWHERTVTCKDCGQIVSQTEEECELDGDLMCYQCGEVSAI